jgi:RND family efflux transporter MFP subunit
MQDAKLGEIVAPNVSIVSIVSENKLEIEANVPEADIVKVKIGNNAKMTLDAFGNNVIFEGVVVSIDPGETMLEGVATYKTTLQFLSEDERVKTGMTANIDILTQKKEGVLVIPQRVVTSRNGRDVVKVVQPDGTIAEKEVQTGLRGSDGNIEIVSGLQEGDKLAGL